MYVTIPAETNLGLEEALFENEETYKLVHSVALRTNRESKGREQCNTGPQCRRGSRSGHPSVKAKEGTH